MGLDSKKQKLDKFSQKLPNHSFYTETMGRITSSIIYKP